MGNRKLIGKLISVEAKWINRFFTDGDPFGNYHNNKFGDTVIFPDMNHTRLQTSGITFLVA